MQATMGTMATETLSVAGNIFVSQVGPAAPCPHAHQQRLQGGRVSWVPVAPIQSEKEMPGSCQGGWPLSGPFYLLRPQGLYQLRDSQNLQMVHLSPFT